MKPDDLSERLLDFAVRIGKVVDALPETRLGQHIAGQLVRSGTSPAPNYEEACAAESRRDFIHKVRIALKPKQINSQYSAALGDTIQCLSQLVRHGFTSP